MRRMPGTNARRSGPPKHQNSFAWVPASADKHNTLQDKVSKLDLRGGVCDKCAAARPGRVAAPCMSARRLRAQVLRGD